MPTPTIEQVDPKSLLTDLNIRLDTKLAKDFVESIKTHGVLQPIVVVRTTDGELRVRFGQRRTLAAIKAQHATVPVVVAGDEGSGKAENIARIVGQYAENEHRAGLTTGEKIDAVQQLSAFGMKPAAIAKQTRIDKGEVEAATRLGDSAAARSAIEEHDLSLEDAAALVEFEDDERAKDQILLAAWRGWGMENTLARLREQREDDRLLQAKCGELEAAGVTVTDQRFIPSRHVIENLASMFDLDLTVESHASCPGHAAKVEVIEVDPSDELDEDEWQRLSDARSLPEPYTTTEVTYYCEDPVGNGHVTKDDFGGRPQSATSSPANEPDPEAEAKREAEKKAERQKVLKNNKAWRKQEQVRREWLRTLLSKKKPPKGAMEYVTRQLLDGNYPLATGIGGSNTQAKALLGVDDLDTATGDRCTVVLLAIVLGAHEESLFDQSWRHPQPHVARYLSQLASWGYEPSEVVQTIIDALSNK